MIKISNLQKSFGDLTVLQDINLEIDKKDIYGLVGASGAGKSTLLRCINGLEIYDNGNLNVEGVEVKLLKEKELREFRKNVGMIFQNFSLLERKSVYENIALPMECWGYNKRQIDKKIKELLELVGLEDKINSRPRELSGGQKQRVAIARALALEPSILLCDEATSALDPNTTKSILSLLREINEKLELTIVVVAHQMSVVKQVCNKMSILTNGRMVSEGRVEDIFLDNPKVLQELLGDTDHDVLPIHGFNIKLITRVETQKSSVLSDISIATNVKYSIVWGNMDKYRDDILGSFIINIDERDKEKITRYLNEENIEWREV